MTAIANFPDIRPSLLLDFANSGRVDPRIQCTRASSATCFGSDGKLRTVPANVPRIDYDPATGKCLGLLIEEARTNLLRYTDLFSSGWGVTGAVLMDSNVVTPNNTLSKKLNEETEGTEHNIGCTFTPKSDTDYVFSIYVKAAERKFCNISIRSFASQVAGNNIRVNLETGEHTVPVSGTYFQAKYVGAGWWRLSLSTKTTATPSTFSPTIFVAQSLSSHSYSGVAGNGIYIWGGQLEEGTVPTSYIQSEASAVTRAADVVRLSSEALSFNPQQGAIFIEWVAYPTFRSFAPVLFDTVANSSSNRISLFGATSSATELSAPAPIISKNGVQQLGTNWPVAARGVVHRQALSYAEGDMSAVMSNMDEVKTSNGSVPPVEVFKIGSTMTGHISRFAYYSRKIPVPVLRRLVA